MSSCAEVRATRLAAWFALAVLTLGTAGCYRAKRCGASETCNYVDDDCDGRYDEPFRDESGRYGVDPAHCGGCDIDCAAVFPTASVTACVADDTTGGVPLCRILACPEGSHRTDDGACAPDVPTLCRPCRVDDDCGFVEPRAVCDLVDASSGLGRCMPSCFDTACPEGLACGGPASAPRCLPLDPGYCACGPDAFDVAFGCLAEAASGQVCEGEQLCTRDGLAACEPVTVEDCDGTDDDCDGEVDEDFRDDTGRYVDTMHCGGCQQPCVPPGPAMEAECALDATAPAGVVCLVTCVPGFVDVDGLSANGCECERWDGTGPPPSAGGDGDCDGVPDDATDFVYVTPTGNDANPGTLARPIRTVQAGVDRARLEGKDVLVARGLYEGPVTLVAGVSVYGGYRPDFRDRSLTLYPVVVEARAPGEPALVCRAIATATRVDGITFEGRDALADGEGSTTVYADGCSELVTFADVTVVSAHGAPGTRGASSAEVLLERDGLTLPALDGLSATQGIADSASASCRTLVGGVGGGKSCGRVVVSGGDGGAAGCPALTCSQGLPCGNAGCTDYVVAGVCDVDAVLRDAVPNGPGVAGRGPDAGQGGEPTYNAPTNRGICNFCDDNPTLARDGVAGVDGSDGTPGLAGEGCGVASQLDPVSGRVRGGDGTGGGDGGHGGGGGGGSAGSGYAVIGGTVGTCSDRAGGSGGGGGSGGCGAPGARGGRGGGASVGVVVRLAPDGTGPTFLRSRIVPVSGGDGGDGGLGAAGGAPGAGAAGGRPSFWCSRSGGRGGDGGAGGDAGGGGGGCGGGAHGVLVVTGGLDARAYVARLGRADGARIEATGRGGRAGAGGESPTAPGGSGLPGSSEPIAIWP